MDYIIDINLSGKQFREVYATTFIAKIFTGVDPNHMDIRSPCGAGIGQVAYNYDGKIYTCDEGRMLARMGIDHFQIGQVEESGIRTYQGYITSPVTRTMVAVSTTEGAPGFNDYVYKPYTGICPIHNFKTLGNIYANFSMDRKRKLEEAIIDIIFDKARNPQIKDIFLSWLRK